MVTATPDREPEPGPRLDATYRELNERFYSAEPGDYFDTRWHALLLMAGRPTESLALLAEGVTYGHIHAALTAGTPPPEAVRNYVLIESQVLLHQTSETLLRLYLAHATPSGCAWLDVAAEISHGKFKQRVRDDVLHLASEHLHRRVQFVFLGSEKTPEHVSEDDWNKARSNLVTLLQRLASTWLEDAHLYNSLKHGLSIVPGTATIAFAQNADLSDARELGRGPSVEFLELKRPHHGRPTWQRTTQWVDESETLALAAMARQMIDSLWAFARARYAGGPIPDRLFFPVDFDASTVRSADRSPVRRWSVSIGVEQL